MSFMLIITEYTKEELQEIFNTDRIDNIKRSLDRLGYKYQSNGKRGNNYRLEILELPDPFKITCIEELGVAANTDFKTFKFFFYCFFNDEGFPNLPIAEMERRLRDKDIITTRNTISKWIKLFRDNYLVGINNCECSYFVTYTIEDKKYADEISKETYNAAWAAYWSKKAEGSFAMRAEMRRVAGGTVFKKYKVEKNAFGLKMIDKLNGYLN